MFCSLLGIARLHGIWMSNMIDFCAQLKLRTFVMSRQYDVLAVWFFFPSA